MLLTVGDLAVDKMMLTGAEAASLIVGRSVVRRNLADTNLLLFFGSGNDED